MEIISRAERILGLRAKPRWRSPGPIVEGRVPLKGYDRLIIPERPKWRGAVLKRRDFLVAAGMLPFAFRVGRSVARLRGRGASSAAASGFLPSGHWLDAQIPFQAIYPRSGVASYARQSWAYYDGTHSIPMILPMEMLGLAYPIVWSISEAPAGSAIGMIYSASGTNYGGYGDLVWYPQEAFTTSAPADFVINGTGQDETVEELSWSTATSSSTTQFVFASPSGSDANAGTYSAPLETLQGLFGASSGATTFPGASAYLFGGTYDAYIPSGATDIPITTTATPVNIMGIPGQAPTIDITDGGAVACFGWSQTSPSAFFFQNLTFTGESAANNNEAYRHFWPGNGGSYYVFHNISFPNVYAGENAANNSAAVYWSDAGYGAGVFTEYIVLKGISETNRTAPQSGQSYGLACMYGTQYGVAEFCETTNNAGITNLYLKASNVNWSRRYNILNVSAGYATSSGDQLNNEGESGNDEVCYNLMVNTGASTYVTRLNENDQSTATTLCAWYRNTVVGGAHSVGSQTDSGPFEYTSEVIEWGSLNAAIYYYESGVGYVDTLPLPSEITNTNTECQAASSVVDDNYNLTGDYASYAGRRGWQIE